MLHKSHWLLCYFFLFDSERLPSFSLTRDHLTFAIKTAFKAFLTY